MLLELKVSNFAVIDQLDVHFLRPGFNVLSGETGAGKSILIKSLGLLLGGKATPDMIRAGKDQAIIEGAFDLTDRKDVLEKLSQAGIELDEPLLVVRRILSSQGKHRVYINGSLATLNVLENVASGLVEITGQHENQTLLKKSTQLEIVDNFASLRDLKSQYLEAYSERQRLIQEMAELKASAQQRDMRLDFLRFQVEEIDAFGPVANEETELASELARTTHSAKLMKFAQNAEDVLYSGEDSALSKVGHVLGETQAMSQLDPSLREYTESLKQAKLLLEDAAYGLRKYGQNVDADEERLSEVQERLSAFKKLQKKYGATSEEILMFRQKAGEELSKLENAEVNIKEFEKKQARISEQLKELALQLRKRRQKAAQELVQLVNKELNDLNMKGAAFVVDFQALEDFSATGLDELTFMIKPSLKDLPRPLGKAASGGELSRIMLAIKQVITEGEWPSTFLFDEVDAGVSGPTAEKVGRKLKRTGIRHQVICITHLPQVAAYADAHFLITKEVVKGMVKSQVTELSESDRVKELARMISGEKTTTASLAHAKEMIGHAEVDKKTMRLKHRDAEL